MLAARPGTVESNRFFFRPHLFPATVCGSDCITGHSRGTMDTKGKIRAGMLRKVGEVDWKKEFLPGVGSSWEDLLQRCKDLVWVRILVCRWAPPVPQAREGSGGYPGSQPIRSFAALSLAGIAHRHRLETQRGVRLPGVLAAIFAKTRCPGARNPSIRGWPCSPAFAWMMVRASPVLSCPTYADGCV